MKKGSRYLNFCYHETASSTAKYYEYQKKHRAKSGDRAAELSGQRYPSPSGREGKQPAVIQVAGNGQACFFCRLTGIQADTGYLIVQGGGDTCEMEPVGAVKNSLPVKILRGAQSGEEEGDEVVYESLVNRASVIGNTYVGGIIGRMETLEDKEFQIKACKNYGRVEAVRGSSDAPDSGRYIGGIAGWGWRTK